MKTEDELYDEACKWWDQQWRFPQSETIKGLYIKIRRLEEQVKDLLPTDEQLAKYPSLREAFEQYSVIKRLTTENDKT